MEKLLLAIGDAATEEAIKEALKQEYVVVGKVVFRDMLLRQIRTYEPKVVIYCELLKGQEDSLLLMHQIRQAFPKVRIVFLAGMYEKGSRLLSELVGRGIYDFYHTTTGTASLEDILHLVRHPREYADVSSYQAPPERMDETVFGVEKGVEVVDIPEVIPESIIAVPNVEAAIQVEVEATPPPIHEDSTTKQTHPQDSSTTQTAPPIEKEARSFWQRWLGSEKSATKMAHQFNSPSLVAFTGGKAGVGNTSLAFYVAEQMAFEGRRVLFIELNDRASYVQFTYDIAPIQGLEKALRAMKEHQIHQMEECILTHDVRKQQAQAYSKAHRVLPETLDFLLFSPDFLQRISSEIPYVDQARTLFMQLSLQGQYDAVIVDTTSSWHDSLTQQALFCATYVFMTVTQDICSLAQALQTIKQADQEGVRLLPKLTYLLNRYVSPVFPLRDIEKQLKEVGQGAPVLSFPDVWEVVIQSQFEAQPWRHSLMKSHQKFPHWTELFQSMRRGG